MLITLQKETKPRKKTHHSMSFSLNLFNLQCYQDCIMKLDIADQWEVKFATKESITYYILNQGALCTPGQVWFGSLTHQPAVFPFIFSYNVTKENHKTESRHKDSRFFENYNTEFFLTNYSSNPRPRFWTNLAYHTSIRCCTVISLSEVWCQNAHWIKAHSKSPS